MLAAQDVRYDVANRVETYVTTHLGGFWDLVERVPAVHRRVNGVLIDRAIRKIPTRPTCAGSASSRRSCAGGTSSRTTSRSPTSRSRRGS